MKFFVQLEFKYDKEFLHRQHFFVIFIIPSRDRIPRSSALGYSVKAIFTGKIKQWVAAFQLQNIKKGMDCMKNRARIAGWHGWKADS